MPLTDQEPLIMKGNDQIVRLDHVLVGCVSSSSCATYTIVSLHCFTSIHFNKYLIEDNLHIPPKIRSPCHWLSSYHLHVDNLSGALSPKTPE